MLIIFFSKIAASTDDPRSLLKAVMTVEEFKISVSQQRELENIKGNLLHNDIHASGTLTFVWFMKSFIIFWE